jgi:hypothetical protein
VHTWIAGPYAGKQRFLTWFREFPLCSLICIQGIWSSKNALQLLLLDYRSKDVYPILKNKIDSIHRDVLQQVASIDGTSLQINQKQGKQEAVKAVTSTLRLQESSCIIYG